jgi:hypothetical protein
MLTIMLHSAGPGERHHCQGQASLPDARVHARLVCCHDFDARYEEWLVIHALPFPCRRHRGTFPPSGVSYDQLMVHQRRIPASHGYLARR